MTKKEKILKISQYIRHKIRDAKANVSIIEAIIDCKRRSNNKFTQHLADVAWAQNWSLLVINMCTIFERRKEDGVICSLNEIWKIVNSYTRLSENQKRRKKQLSEARNNFRGFYLDVVNKNRQVRNECIAHNDYFKKRKYKVLELESQKELIDYAEHYLAIVGGFIGVNIYPLSRNSKLEKCLYEVLK